MTFQNLDLNYFKGIAERVKIEKERMKKIAEKIVPIQSPAVPPYVEDNLPYWVIPRVNYQSIIGDAHVSKSLLEDGATKTQKEWSEYSKAAKENGGFYTPDLPLLYSTLEKAFEMGTVPKIQNMRDNIQMFSRGAWITTLTKINYISSIELNLGNFDNVIHNIGLESEYKIDKNIIGLDGDLSNITEFPLIYTLFGKQIYAQRVKDVFNWLNETSSVHLFRLNERPAMSDEERIVRFSGLSSISKRADIDLDGNIDSTNPSLGLRFVSLEDTFK